jgi:hypothetical protein
MVDSSLKGHRKWFWLCLLGSTACGAAATDRAHAKPRAGSVATSAGAPSEAEPGPPVGAPRHRPEAASLPFAGGYRTIEAVGQSLEFPLPDAQGWRRDPREKRTWVARHLTTGSTLMVRAWDHDDIAHIDDCERQARIWRPELPQAAAHELLDTREQPLAGVYAGRLTLFVRGPAPAAPSVLTGYALAFGSDARSCLMLAFATSASGPSASSALAERLGVMAEAVFGRARRVGIGERVLVPRM